MFVPKEKLEPKQFERFQFGSEVDVQIGTASAQRLVVTRLGLISMAELQAHPNSNPYVQADAVHFGKRAGSTFKF